MPELPEVETVRRGLAPVMEGRTLAKVTLNRADLRFAFPQHFAARLAGRRVVHAGRRAKYLAFDLDDGAVLVMHLGMSGSFRIEAAPVAGDAFHHARGKDAAHDHAVFVLDDGATVTYNDPRRFGFMDLVAAGDSYPAFEKLGPEPTGNSLGGDVLYARLKDKRTSLKAALLDQSVVAGLGNIYVCEALHRSGLSPERQALSLDETAATRLAEDIRAVIAEAIEAGGSSLRDYVQADGSLGYFQHRFRAYDREGEPCVTPGCGGSIARIVQGGRSTFYCASCQKRG